MEPSHVEALLSVGGIAGALLMWLWMRGRIAAAHGAGLAEAAWNQEESMAQERRIRELEERLSSLTLERDRLARELGEPGNQAQERPAELPPHTSPGPALAGEASR